MTIVRPDAVIPAWDDLTPDQRFRYAGNLDPWAGPVDPVAQERHLARAARPHAAEPGDGCGCWMADCAECGPRRADGQRPKPGAMRAHALRHDADLLAAKTCHAERRVTR